MAAFGLDYDSIRKRNPRVVYASIMGLMRDSRFLTLELRKRNLAELHDMVPGIPAVNCGMILNGVCHIPNVKVETYLMATNTPRVDTYRGAGRPEATYLIETMVDQLARKLGMDPAEVRRRNFIQPEQFPYTTPIHAFSYDSGDYPGNLKKALEIVGYERQRAEQKKLRETGHYIGIGLATYTEFTGIGGVVLRDVIDNTFARKAVDKGADGLIAVAAGAGGHAGTISPFPLIQEIREWFDGPLALSGAIATGRAVLAAQAAGADFAYFGSAFIATEEARAEEAYKEMITKSASSDIIYSNLFTGGHGNYLRPSVIRAGLDPHNLPQSDPSAMDFSQSTGVKAWKHIWGSGQGIGAIKKVLPVADFVQQLVLEYRGAMAELQGKFAPHPSSAL